MAAGAQSSYDGALFFIPAPIPETEFTMPFKPTLIACALAAAGLLAHGQAAAQQTLRVGLKGMVNRSEEHTSELQSL